MKVYQLNRLFEKKNHMCIVHLINTNLGNVEVNRQHQYRKRSMYIVALVILIPSIVQHLKIFEKHLK